MDGIGCGDPVTAMLLLSITVPSLRDTASSDSRASKTGHSLDVIREGGW